MAKMLWAAGVAASAAAADVHPERAAQVALIRSTPGVLWEAAVDERFASEAPGASRYVLGVKGDQAAEFDKATLRKEMVEDTSPAVDIPEHFDSAEHWPHCAKIIGDIRDQSNCGCCWAFAGAEAASDRMCIATEGKLTVPLSSQDVCFNGAPLGGGCGGGMLVWPWGYIRDKGAVTGGQYKGSGPFGKGFCSDFSLPHCHHHGPQGKDPYPAENTPGCPKAHSPAGPSSCDADAEAPHNDFSKDKYQFKGLIVNASGEEGIQRAILAGGPMEVAFTVFSDFENYVSGIYHHVTGKESGGHAVKVVGWGVENGHKYWKIANSWNPYWGEGGHFRILRGTNECGIESNAVASSPDAKWSRAGDEEAQIVV